MLNLTRKEGEEILIGNDIVIKVITIKNCNNVMIGISAPQDVKILRREIADRKRALKQEEENHEYAVA